tara:strand:+ start:1306 stop:2415 length:1110 start_codon:yes stop_codon:yes gene_type:complete
MKLLMEQWRKFLKEGISDVVYHYTNGLERGAKILEQNRFMASGGFTKDVESELGKGKLYYFSTARTPANAYTGNYPQGVIFKLDGRALGQKYKGVPLDYWATKKRSSKKAANPDPGETEGFEAEDRILLDEPYIEDADRYIDEIHFAIPLYRFEKGMFDDEPKRKAGSAIEAYQMKGLRDGVAIAEQRNIPYYIHIDKQTFPFVEVGKKKALTSLAAFMEEVEKSGVTVNEPRDQASVYKSRSGAEFGEDEVFLYVQAAQDILAGKERFEGASVKDKVGYRDEAERKREGTVMFRNLTGSPNMYGRFYREIDNSLHNVSSNPKARKTLEMLASLMRSTKQKTLKDFENYLNQVYKQNHPDGDPTGYRNT